MSAGSLYSVWCSVAWILFTFFVTFDDFRVSIELAVGLYSLWLGLINDLIFYALKGFFNYNNLD